MNYILINKKTNEEIICDKITIDSFDYFLSQEEMEIENDEWCFEIHENYESDTIKFLDKNDPKMAWWLRKLNMSYRKKSPTDFEFHKVFDNTCKKIIATNNPNIDSPQIIEDYEIAFTKNLIETKTIYYNHKLFDTHKKGFIEGFSLNKDNIDINEMIEFIEWCNYPIYRDERELGFRLRVVPQFPDYNSYIVIDETGNSILPKGMFFTTKELIQVWKEQKNKTVYYE
jgi:hypothetical protein